MAASRVATLGGFLTVGFGMWLIDSAVQNRPPIKTLEDILRDPRGLKAILANNKGSYVTPVSGIISTSMSNAIATATANDPTKGGVGAAGIVAWARAQIGKPYKWGATGPDSFDCSGLAQAAYAHVGIKIPRTTYQQVLVGSPISKNALALGDLVFPDPGHVQIYSGNGNVIEAPHTGSNVREVKMWGFMAARRIITAPSPQGGGPTVTKAG